MNWMPTASSAAKITMCRSEMLSTTIQSPRGGRIRLPVAMRTTSRATMAMTERIADAHSGDTSATIAFITGHVMPHDSTTTANSRIAAVRESVALVVIS
jgi:hypothetical protein